MHADLVFFPVDEKDGKTVQRKDSGATYEFKSSGRKHSMVIKNATVHEEGEYVATVGDQECSCELTVVELPPEFVHKIQPVKVGPMTPFTTQLRVFLVSHIFVASAVSQKIVRI